MRAPMHDPLSHAVSLNVTPGDRVSIAAANDMVMALVHRSASEVSAYAPDPELNRKAMTSYATNLETQYMGLTASMEESILLTLDVVHASVIRWVGMFAEPVRWSSLGVAVGLIELAMLNQDLSVRNTLSRVLYRPNRRSPGRPYQPMSVPGGQIGDLRGKVTRWVPSLQCDNMMPPEPPWADGEMKVPPAVDDRSRWFTGLRWGPAPPG